MTGLAFLTLGATQSFKVDRTLISGKYAISASDCQRDRAGFSFEVVASRSYLIEVKSTRSTFLYLGEALGLDSELKDYVGESGPVIKFEAKASGHYYYVVQSSSYASVAFNTRVIFAEDATDSADKTDSEFWSTPVLTADTAERRVAFRPLELGAVSSGVLTPLGSSIVLVHTGSAPDSFDVKSVATGSCGIEITGDQGSHLTLPVSVTTTRVIIQ